MQSRLQPRGQDVPTACLKKNGSNTSMPRAKPADANVTSTVPVSLDAIETLARQITAEERVRRSSLIPQRSSSTKQRNPSRRQAGPAVETPLRTFSGPKTLIGLQRSQSTTKVQQLRQPLHIPRKPAATYALQQTNNESINPNGSNHQPSINGDDDASSDTQQHQATRSSTTSGAASPGSEGDGPAPSLVEDGMTLRSERRVGAKPPVILHRRQNSVPQTPAGFNAVGQREHLLTGQERLRSTDVLKSVPTPQPNKPTFSTLQQHFTPKRNVQGTVASLSGKLQTDPEAAERAARESEELKLELLQLHMLHRDSLKVRRQWECSAEECYRIRFESLSLAHMTLTARECEFQEQVNATAVIAWGSGNDGFTIERKVQVLSRILSEMWDLSEPNGKYSCLLESFEHWYGRASKILQLQTPTITSIESLGSVEGIGDGWKVEVSLLRSKMRSFQEQLRKLGEVQPNSELARCVQALKTMIGEMLEELDIVQGIESELVSQGEEWVKESIDLLAADVRYGIRGPLGPSYVTSTAR